MTVAFEIRYPWRAYKNPKNEWEKSYHDTFITIWHVDPEKDGTDDSCGWFMRSRHGNKQTLEKIVKALDFDWDRTFTSDTTKYNCGLFMEDGKPHLSVIGITLNLFFRVALEVFGTRKKATKYLNKNLFDILLFAENCCDSLHESITLKFGNINREERIRNMAVIIYGYILRDIRPWYRHPRWHIHHWKIQIHPLQMLKRTLFSKCCQCGRRLHWGESVGSNNWNAEGPRWFKGEKDLICSTCSPSAFKSGSRGLNERII